MLLLAPPDMMQKIFYTFIVTSSAAVAATTDNHQPLFSCFPGTNYCWFIYDTMPSVHSLACACASLFQAMQKKVNTN